MLKPHTSEGDCAGVIFSGEGGSLVLSPDLRLETAQTIGFPVQEFCTVSQCGMDLLDLSPHLLDNGPVIRMALRHGPQFPDVNRLSEIELDGPSHPIGQRDDPLR